MKTVCLIFVVCVASFVAGDNRRVHFDVEKCFNVQQVKAEASKAPGCENLEDNDLPADRDGDKMGHIMGCLIAQFQIANGDDGLNLTNMRTAIEALANDGKRDSLLSLFDTCRGDKTETTTNEESLTLRRCFWFGVAKHVCPVSTS